MEKVHLKDVKKMWKCLKACFDHNVFAVCESESWKKMHRCWNGNIKLSHGENLCASHKCENFRRKILFIQYHLRLLLWLEKNGQKILIAIWHTNLRVIKRVAPPDDAAALLHVEDVRRTLQQMGLFQTFTCVTRIFKTNIEYCRESNEIYLIEHWHQKVTSVKKIIEHEAFDIVRFIFKELKNILGGVWVVWANCW